MLTWTCTSWVTTQRLPPSKQRHGFLLVLWRLSLFWSIILIKILFINSLSINVISIPAKKILFTDQLNKVQVTWGTSAINIEYHHRNLLLDFWNLAWPSHYQCMNFAKDIVRESKASYSLSRVFPKWFMIAQICYETNCQCMSLEFHQLLDWILVCTTTFEPLVP